MSSLDVFNDPSVTCARMVSHVLRVGEGRVLVLEWVTARVTDATIGATGGGESIVRDCVVSGVFGLMLAEEMVIAGLPAASEGGVTGRIVAAVID
jgi:hypothetical protein